MPSPAQAFQVAFDLTLPGVYFDSATVLAAVRPQAEGELAARAEAQGAALKSHGKQARQRIAAVHAALAAAGLDAPAAPETPEAYAGWVETCSNAFYETLDDTGVRAYLAGWWLGQWTLAANVSAVGLYLLDASPDDAYLREVLQNYAASLGEATEGLAQARDGAPEHLDGALEQAHAVIAEPPIEGEPMERAGALQEALEQLDPLIATVKATLE
jgi:hypothetical protein